MDAHTPAGDSPGQATLPPAQPVWRPQSVAIVHDYLNQLGGAERVVLAMARMFPGAPVYTSIYRPQSTHPEFASVDVRVSPLDRLPVDRAFRALLPLYPAAIRLLGTLDNQLVLSSSSAWAHGVRTAPRSLHLVYCHAPARWLYNSTEYMPSRAARLALAPARAMLRGWDRHAARRADGYIANSENVRRRVRATYGVDADVVHPPVEVGRFRPRPRGERLLVVSRLLAYKRVDLAISAATTLGVGLDIVGTGPEMERLRSMAGPSVTLHGRLSDRAVTELLEGCWALCVPGAEDFGIVTVEALAAGKPVVALASGGALEILEDGVTGALFSSPTVEQLVRAIRRAADLDTSPDLLSAAAQRYSFDAFALNLMAAIGRAHARHRPS